MDVKEAIKKVENSKEFKEFKNKNPDYYLAHAFTILDSAGFKGWQIGFYSKKLNNIAVFEFEHDTLKLHPGTEVFKEERKLVKSLKLEDVKISYDDALKLVEKTIKESYKEPLVRAIVLLQTIEKYGLVWNMTIITTAFNVINVKLDANSGKILKHSKENLMSWNKQ